MGYLYYRDVINNIQEIPLEQITKGDTSIIYAKIELAEAIIRSALIQRFDIDDSLRDLNLFSLTDTYYGKSRIYLNASAYVAATSYSVEDLTLNSGNIYICTDPTTGAFDPSKWTLLGRQWQIFVAKTPNPVYSYETAYSAGNEVWYLNNNYTALKSSTGIKPDDTEGADYWQNDGEYSFTGELPTDTDFYTSGDDRDPFIVDIGVKITIKELLPLIAPRNYTQNRIDDYTQSMSYLKDFARGEKTLNLPLIQPEQGGRIRWGSVPKVDLDY